MGENGTDAVRGNVHATPKLELHGSSVTSNAGLPLCRELDAALDLTAMVGKCPPSGVEKKLDRLSGRDRIIETAHSGHEHEAIRETPAKRMSRTSQV